MCSSPLGEQDFAQDQMIPSSIARSTARVRSRTPSFEKMLATYDSTVLTVSDRAIAIAPFERPSAMRASTSDSRAVRRSSGPRGRAPYDW